MAEPLPGLEAIIAGLMHGGQPTGALAGALMPLMRGLSGQLDATQSGFTPFMFNTLSALSKNSGIGDTASGTAPTPLTSLGLPSGAKPGPASR